VWEIFRNGPGEHTASCTRGYRVISRR